MEPADEAQVDRYLYGNAVLQQQVGPASVNISFFDATQKVVVFNLEVRNEGSEPITYDPAASVLTGPGVGNVRSAIDPELELFSLDMREVKRRRTNRTLAAVGAVAAVAGTVYAVTSDAPAAEFVPAYTAQDAAIDLTFAVVDLGVNAGMAALYDRRFAPAPEGVAAPGPDNRLFWLDYAMRKTTIMPGEAAIGKLVFERTLEEGVCQLTTEVPGVGEAEFAFRQRVFR